MNVHTESFATIIPQYVSSYCFIEDDRAVAAFYIWYFEGGILNLYLMASQDVTSNCQIPIISLRHISKTSCNSITYYVNKYYGGAVKESVEPLT
jgi:hypothetical protein